MTKEMKRNETILSWDRDQLAVPCGERQLSHTFFTYLTTATTRATERNQMKIREVGYGEGGITKATTREFHTTKHDARRRFRWMMKMKST